MDTSRLQPLRRLVLALDALCIVVAMGASRGAHDLLHTHWDVVQPPPRFEDYAVLVYLVVPIWLALLGALGLTQLFERRFSRLEILSGLAKVHAIGLPVLTLVLFLTQSVINRSLVAIFLFFSFALLYVERALLTGWIRYQHAHGQLRTNVLLVGEPSPRMRRYVEQAQAESLHPQLVGRLGAAADEDPALPPRLGSAEELPRVLHEHAIDQVLLFAPYSEPARANPLLASCETVGVPALVAIEADFAASAAPRVLALNEEPFLAFDSAPKPVASLAFKHAADFVVSALLLLALAPVLLAIAAAIALTMGRPILFGQQRAGLFGRRFTMWKFRTMRNGAAEQQQALLAHNEMSGPVFKMSNDPRVTPLGRFLRRWSLDELPQLFNVLLGHMSLVGPRPLPIDEQQRITGWQRRRLSMKPGITGMWQVSGRNQIDFEDWMRLDLKYVDGWSIGLDARILLKTFPAVLSRRGAS